MNSSGPNKTTWLGGWGLALVAAIPLAAIITTWLPSGDAAFLLLRSAPSQLVVDLVLLGSCVVLAFGYRSEHGIVGSSVLGRVGFLILGLASGIQTLFLFLLNALYIGGSPATIGIGTALEVLPFVAMTLAAVAVVRAHVLTGFARWILLAVAAAEVVQLALSAVQNASQGYYTAVVLYGAAVPLLLLLGAGVSFALHGHTASIRHRLQTIHATWRATT